MKKAISLILSVIISVTFCVPVKTVYAARIMKHSNPLSMGTYRSAIINNGNLYICGRYFNDNDIYVPQKIINGITAVSAGYGSAGAITSDGILFDPRDILFHETE